MLQEGVYIKSSSKLYSRAVTVKATAGNAEGNTISTADYGASGDNLSAIETAASYDAFGNILEERRANGSYSSLTMNGGIPVD